MNQRSLNQVRLLPALLLAGVCGSALAQQAQPQQPQPQPPIRLYAAGSLTGALSAVAKQYTAETGEQVDTVFGPSGLLRERMEHGEAVDVFASADMDSPQRLYELGKASRPVVFTRNRLCVSARGDLHITTDNLLDKLLDPAVGIGTSTPKADPGGDYAWQLFAKADTVRPGARATLEAKAQQLVGGPNSPKLPPGVDALSHYFGNKQVGVFLGYCSSRKPVVEWQPQAGVDRVELPANLAITPHYGLTVLNLPAGPHEAAYRFALYVMSTRGQQILAAYGFGAVGVPTE